MTRSLIISFGLVIVGVVVFLSSCQTSKVSESLKSPAEVLGEAPRSQPSTPSDSPVEKTSGVGEDYEGRFSRDGSRVIFISRSRPSHRQAQVYELTIATGIERRMTFHDGDDASPVYTNDPEMFLYASENDELKDDDYAIGKLRRTYTPEQVKTDPTTVGPSRTFPRMELYLQSRNGQTLERLTRSPAFDGEIDFDVKTKRLVFVSVREGRPNLLAMTLGKDRGPTRLAEASVTDRFPRFSLDGKMLVWSRALDDGHVGNAKLMIGNNPRKSSPLTDGKAADLHATWHPNGKEIVFSSNRGSSGKYNLYIIDHEGRCVRRLLNDDVDQLHPDVSPDGKRLLYSERDEDRSRIRIVDFPAPDPKCLDEGPSVPK